LGQGTCPTCSALSSCDKCTEKGCFWTTGNQCQDTKCSTCKKYGDCFLPGCSAFKSCSTCLPQSAGGVQCQWNVQAKSCDPGCFQHSPDTPLTCIKQGGTCPAAATLGPIVVVGGGGLGPKPTINPAAPCSARPTCKTCAAADGKCVWDLKIGCISAKDYICFEPCVRQAAQCPACSTLTSQGCGVCTNKGCFWNPAGTGTCQEVKCATCKKNGDCVPPGCTQYKACGTCIGAVDTLSQTPCQWNANTKQCNAGCIHQPDVPTTCIAKGGTCPAPVVSTIKPVFTAGLALGTDNPTRQLSTVKPVLTTACPSRTSCSSCTSDNRCLWDPSRGGCVDGADTCFGSQYCARTPAQCPVCSAPALKSCAICTERGCFWNPSTATCVPAKTATTKKYGDCIPAGCTQYKSCSTCLTGSVPGSNPATTCTWNAHSNSCFGGCIHDPDVPYKCFKAPQTCPAGVVGPTGLVAAPTGIIVGTVGPLVLSCGARTSCKTCTSDNKCLWDPSRGGCVDGADTCFGSQYCARSPAQCQASCSVFANCGICTDRGCFWNPSTLTCVDTKTATTKKSGDCVPVGCSQYTTCQTCLPAAAPLANPATTCTWNAHSKKCAAGCFHEPDAPYSCFKKPQTCPV